MQYSLEDYLFSYAFWQAVTVAEINEGRGMYECIQSSADIRLKRDQDYSGPTDAVVRLFQDIFRFRQPYKNGKFRILPRKAFSCESESNEFAPIAVISDNEICKKVKVSRKRLNQAQENVGALFNAYNESYRCLNINFNKFKNGNFLVAGVAKKYHFHEDYTTNIIAIPFFAAWGLSAVNMGLGISLVSSLMFAAAEGLGIADIIRAGYLTKQLQDISKAPYLSADAKKITRRRSILKNMELYPAITVMEAVVKTANKIKHKPEKQMP